MKFSIIIPVYNSSEYLNKCLDSVFNQTYKDYEVIVINDGSTDDSQKIIDDYKTKHKNIRSVYKKNAGLSEARNDGVTYSNSDYIIFLDSDDYIGGELLSEIAKVTLKNDIDVVRFQGEIVNSNYEKITDNVCDKFDSCNGEDAFIKIYPSNTLESASLYAYKRKYFLDNSFKYAKGKLHEDFGLTILTILKAKKVISIPYVGNYYYQSDNSITRNNNYSKNITRAYDTLYHYDYLTKEVRLLKLKNIKLIESFLANSIINRSVLLNNKDLMKFIKELKKRKVTDKLLNDTLTRKIKKHIIKSSMFIYIKLFVRG